MRGRQGRGTRTDLARDDFNLQLPIVPPLVLACRGGWKAVLVADDGDPPTDSEKRRDDQRDCEGISSSLRGSADLPFRVQFRQERSDLGRPELPVRVVSWELSTGAGRDECPVQVEEGDLDSARGGCGRGRAAGSDWSCFGSGRRAFLTLCGRRQVEEVSEVRVVQERGSEVGSGEGKLRRSGGGRDGGSASATIFDYPLDTRTSD